MYYNNNIRNVDITLYYIMCYRLICPRRRRRKLKITHIIILLFAKICCKFFSNVYITRYYALSDGNNNNYLSSCIIALRIMCFYAITDLV